MNTRLDPARVRARLTLAFAIALAAISALTALAFATTAQAAAPDFSWTSSLSTTQAGGHPSMTLSYASSSTQPLTRLDTDLPQGLMHRNNQADACTDALYIADNCPASSTVGTVASQLVVGRLPISTPGTIYQLSAASGDAAASFGIVLRPPLSALGLTSKIFIRNQISFANGGGLRSSIVDPPSTVTVLGAALPSRIAQLKLTYNSQTPTGDIALLSNPTSCKTQPLTVRGTFTDGTTRERSSSHTTTGCAAVPFAPTASIQLDNNTAGERTLFSALLGNQGSDSPSALHTGHVVLIGHDFEELGDFDFDSIDSGPRCTEEDAASEAGCPDASAIGDLTAEIEGFGTATGKTYITNSPGHKTVNELTLRGRIKVRFPGGLGGDNDSTISFTGMPQLPITAFKFQSTRAATWITNTCAIRTSRTTARSWGDGHAVDQNVLPAPDCTPAAPTITEGPDRGITINTSHVEYRFSAPGSDVTYECNQDDGEYIACSSHFVDDWQGEGAHVFSVRAIRGGFTGPATTATFTIDTVPPEVSFVGDEYIDADRNGVADKPFRTEDFALEFDASDATSGIDDLRLACSFQSDSDPTAPSTRGVKQPRTHTQGHVQCGGPSLAPPGPGTVTATAYDLAGHVTVLKIGVIVDGAAPEILVNNKALLYSEGPAVEVPIEITDDSLRYPQGEVTVECARTGWDGTVKGSAKIITDRDSGRSKGFCAFADVPEGSFKVTVRGWDPIKKEAFAEGDLVVDRTAPTMAFTDKGNLDADGDGFSDNRVRPARIGYEILVDDTARGSGINPSSGQCLAKPRKGGMVKGIVTISNGSLLRCTIDGLPDGDTDVEISVADFYGHVTVLKAAVTIDGGG